MSFETLFLLIVAVLAILIVLGTSITALVVLRKSKRNDSPTAPAIEPIITESVSDSSTSALSRLSSPHPTIVPTPIEDIESYLAEQRQKLAEFELPELSNTFKGSTTNGERRGVILHLNDVETPLIAFNSQAFNPQTGTIAAETTYGKMEIIITRLKKEVACTLRDG